MFSSGVTTERKTICSESHAHMLLLIKDSPERSLLLKIIFKLLGCLSLLYSAWVKSATKSSLGRKRVSFTLQLTVHRKESQGRNLEARTEAEITEEGYLLTLPQTASFYNSGPPTRKRQLLQWAGSSISFINQDSVPQACLQANLMGAFSLFRVSLPT